MNEIKNEPNYYSLIPATVRYDESLKPNEKLLYSEITSLCNSKGICWASNTYFANLYKVKKNTVSGWINNLKNKGYIKVEVQYKKGTKMIDKRYISIVDGISYLSNGYLTNIEGGISQISKDNNTSINNIKNKEIEVFELINLTNYSKEVKDLFKEFVLERKSNGKRVTPRACEGLIKKLNELSNSDEERLKIIEEAITRQWLTFFEIKDNRPEPARKETSYEKY